VPGIWMAPYLLGTRLYPERLNEHEKWFERQIELDGESNPYIEAEAAYERGWTSYISAVWDMVKQGTGKKDKVKATDTKAE
jgi:hypothetical protein